MSQFLSSIRLNYNSEKFNQQSNEYKNNQNQNNFYQKNFNSQLKNVENSNQYNLNNNNYNYNKNTNYNNNNIDNLFQKTPWGGNNKTNNSDNNKDTYRGPFSNRNFDTNTINIHQQNNGNLTGKNIWISNSKNQILNENIYPSKSNPVNIFSSSKGIFNNQSQGYSNQKSISRKRNNPIKYKFLILK